MNATGWSLPVDWGQAWRAKLAAAKAGTGLAVAALLGDSIGFGYWASNLVSSSWAEILRTGLANAAGNGGSGFQTQAHSKSVMYNPNSGVPAYYQSVAGNVWQESPAWTPAVPPQIYGPGAGALQASASNSFLFNYVYGSQLGVWYLDLGADFTVQIDSVTVGTVKVGTTGLPKRAVFDVPGGQFGVHSWQIVGQRTSSGATTICGVEGLHPTGVRLDNFSFPGLYSGYFANKDEPYHSGTYAGGWQNPADLIIYELGINDVGGQDPAYPGGTPADVWVQNIQTYLDGVMTATYGGDATGKTDVLFLLPMTNLSIDHNVLYSEYKARILGVANTYGAAVLDINALFHGSWNAWQKQGYAGNQTDPTSSGTDSNHPSDAGHAFVASVIGSLIFPLS